MRGDSGTAGSWAAFAEKYVLSFLVLAIAWSDHPRAREWLVDARTGVFAFLVIFQRSIRFLLDLAIGGALLGGRRPAPPAPTLKENVAALAPLFFPLAYVLVDWFPAPLRENIIPPPWQAPLGVAGLALGAAGYALAAWSVVSLGRSFGVFVAVRGVVDRGPYRYVRHPMYLGYACVGAGAALEELSGALVLLLAIHGLLFVYRARVEEVRLAEAGADYRDYAGRTGFLFPRF
jgi:protein-S-isoprenylcysteine O-methyltransferase Ste14